MVMVLRGTLVMMMDMARFKTEGSLWGVDIRCSRGPNDGGGQDRREHETHVYNQRKSFDVERF